MVDFAGGTGIGKQQLPSAGVVPQEFTVAAPLVSRCAGPLQTLGRLGENIDARPDVAKLEDVAALAWEQHQPDMAIR